MAGGTSASEWQPDQYLKFEKERAQPAVDLVRRIEVAAPGRIIDIGCGTGTSTLALLNAWPDAELTGLDSSQAMLDKARKTAPGIRWIKRSASEDLSRLGSFDIVFSNAALQWIPDHETLIPRLFGLLNRGGALAVQVPYIVTMPMYTEVHALKATPKWKKYFEVRDFSFNYRNHDSFYDMLSPLTKALSLWKTEYVHVMQSHTDLVEWTKGTSLRPYLDILPDEAARLEFTADYTEALRNAYPRQRDGSVLLPFTRVFFLAYNA